MRSRASSSLRAAALLLLAHGLLLGGAYVSSPPLSSGRILSLRRQVGVLRNGGRGGARGCRCSADALAQPREEEACGDRRVVFAMGERRSVVSRVARSLKQVMCGNRPGEDTGMGSRENAHRQDATGGRNRLSGSWSNFIWGHV